MLVHLSHVWPLCGQDVNAHVCPSSPDPREHADVGVQLTLHQGLLVPQTHKRDCDQRGAGEKAAGEASEGGGG